MHCPRWFLKLMINRAWARGYKLMGAFENEFVLLNLVRTRAGRPDCLRPDECPRPMAPVLNAITEALAEQGVFANCSTPRPAPGQFEMPVRYRDALAAADQQVVFRETVRAVAHQHGLVATFVPKLLEAAAAGSAPTFTSACGATTRT